MPRNRGKSIRRPQKKTRTRRKKSRNTRKKINRGGDCNAWADKKNPGNAKSNFHKLCELIESTTGDIYRITPAESTKLLDDMVHLYFNDNSVLEEIYKSMRSKDLCFLEKINIDVENKETFILRHIGKKGQVSEIFSPEIYYKNQIMDCSSNIYAIPISFSGHSNVLIVQKDVLDNGEHKLIVEHFEPHGRFYNRKETDVTNIKLEYMVKKLVYGLFGDPENPATVPRRTIDGKEIKIIKPRDNCPAENKQLQALVSHSEVWGGTCVMFTMWYAFMRLSSPEKSSADIYREMDTILNSGNPVEIIQAVIKAFQGLVSVDTTTGSVNNAARSLHHTEITNIKTFKQLRASENTLLMLKKFFQSDADTLDLSAYPALKAEHIRFIKSELVNNESRVKKLYIDENSIPLFKSMMGGLTIYILAKNKSIEYLNIAGTINDADILFQGLLKNETINFLDINRLRLSSSSSSIIPLLLQYNEGLRLRHDSKKIGIIERYNINSIEDIFQINKSETADNEIINNIISTPPGEERSLVKSSWIFIKIDGKIISPEDKKLLTDNPNVAVYI